jgi:hypothetical protein
MIVITKNASVKCEACGEQRGEYSIKGMEGIPGQMCSGCVLNFMQNNERFRHAVILQAATK